jgi:hypothetical protein
MGTDGSAVVYKNIFPLPKYQDSYMNLDSYTNPDILARGKNKGKGEKIITLTPGDLSPLQACSIESGPSQS